MLPIRPLACTQCRLRRVKCDHEKDICGRQSLACQYPEGRKKKRGRSSVAETSASAEPPTLPNDDWLDALNTLHDTAFIWPPVFDPVDENRDETAHAGSSSGPLLRDPRLVAALENQAATVNEAMDGDLELYYYRFSGSTAIQPGINKVSLRLRKKDNDSIAVPLPTEIFDSEGMPLPSVRDPFSESFYQHMSCLFPAISRQRMQDRFETRTMSQFLANAITTLGSIAAVATTLPSHSKLFLDQTLSFILPHSGLPTTEAVSALMLLAWGTYGHGNESGLWQWTGMAIRMGLDIGLHQISEIYDSPQHLRRARLLFWTLFATDRLISFATGRPSSIAEEVIEIPLPTDEDFFPDPARDTPDYPFQPLEPISFVYFVRLMVIVGRISNVLNGRRGKPRTLAVAVDSAGLSERLSELQIILIQFYSSLPESLRWTSQSFHVQHAKGHGGAFLCLHLWAHAVLAMTYHPDLLHSPSGYVTPLSANMSRNLKLALTSAKQIAECIVFADLAAAETYVSTPQLVQPIFIACMALLQEMRSDAATDGTEIYFRSMARENYMALFKALCRMAGKWKAISAVIDVLEKRSGIPRPAEAATGPAYISIPDTGILRRFKASKDHPQNIAQPTESSLRDSIDRSNTMLMSDLLNEYGVGDIGFESVGMAEVQDLLHATFD